jgi:hypothetical protein
MSETENNNPEEDASGFKVSDRRKFSADGELRDEAEVRDDSPSSEPVSIKDPEPDQERETNLSDDQNAEEQIDFASFVLSLATTALAHLGEIPDPATGEKTENLVAAKQMIDILSILEAKTKGNLEPDEERLMESLLYELRMKYLNQAKIITV